MFADFVVDPFDEFVAEVVPVVAAAVVAVVLVADVDIVVVGVFALATELVVVVDGVAVPASEAVVVFGYIEKPLRAVLLSCNQHPHIDSLNHHSYKFFHVHCSQTSMWSRNHSLGLTGAVLLRE